jgi:transcriptional regulator with XRE-family HTH domain
MLWFCYKLKQYREEHHLTQKQMAEQCHLSESTIARLENPKNKRKIPSYQTLFNLSKYMELEENDPLKMISEERSILIGFLKLMEETERSERRLRAKKRQEALTKK